MKSSKQFHLLRGVTSLRVKMQMTQETFARYLGISKSLVSMVENGHRSLPLKALMKLSELEIAANEQTNAVNSANIIQLKAETDRERSRRENKERCNRHYLNQLRYRYNKMLDNYNDILTAFRHVKLAISLHGNNSQSQTARALLYNQHILYKKLQRCNWTAQVQLKAKICMLEIITEITPKAGIPVAISQQFCGNESHVLSDNIAQIKTILRNIHRKSA